MYHGDGMSFGACNVGGPWTRSDVDPSNGVEMGTTDPIMVVGGVCVPHAPP